jgi:Transposase DDE domain group 1
LQVKLTNSRRRLIVTADGEGVVNHAGSGALEELADRLGLTQGWSAVMAPTRVRRSAHDPGRTLQDLAVMLADGGDCLAHLRVLRDQPDLFGRVASGPTAWRVIDSIGLEQLEGLRQARARARKRAWVQGAKPAAIVLDIDATLVTAHSEKEEAAGNFKGGRLRLPPPVVLPGRQRPCSRRHGSGRATRAPTPPSTT